jgi:hypothetical protein
VIQTVILRATELLSFAGIKISTGYFLNGGSINEKAKHNTFFNFQIQINYSPVRTTTAHNFPA